MRQLWAPDLDVEDLRVWAGPLEPESTPLGSASDALSGAVQRNVSRFALYADRVNDEATGAAKPRLLAQQPGRGPAAMAITQTPRGNPILAGDCGFGCTVSHRGCHALSALCRGGASGIDIERRTDTADVAALMMLVLTPLKHDSTDDRGLRIFDRSVVKESVLEALGLGIAEYLQVLSVFAAGETWLELAVAGPGWPALRTYALQFPPSYAAAPATTEGPYVGRLH